MILRNIYDNLGIKIKWHKKAQSDFDNLPSETVVTSDLYRREGNIKLTERYIKKGPWGDIIKYKALFNNTGRRGELEPRDITTVVEMGA